MPWIAVGVLSAGLGSALPFLLSGQKSHAASDTEEHSEKEHGTETDGSEKSDKKKSKTFTMTKEEDTAQFFLRHWWVIGGSFVI